MLGVPILVGGHLYGMFYLADHEDGRPFTLEDQWLLETLAGYAALAIAGSQVRDQQRRLTLLEERQRIGMELHDGIIQSLYAVGMYLDLMRHTDDIEGKNLKHAIDGLNDVIEDIRSYIMNLRTTKEKTRTMRQTVREVLARLYLPADLVVHLDVPDRMPPFDQDTFDSLCMIVVEALSNTVRHADANSVTVRCSQDPRFFTLMIKDDGCGFEPDKLNGNAGLGLRNMRERARLKGGAMDLNSQPQKGTTLRIVVPLDV
jgi:signal transduction histidine kinase